ncbi:MAG TPA: methylenetetrahydrofolate reductase [NAD(P)H] [Planctomycetota bacterium]|nr:methylenetetrahydrofolate reductase [NAD(P)H] [Planctomycetota bacterium]
MHGGSNPVFSFEFFPPKTPEAADRLIGTIAELKQVHAPDYVSVTYGAGGTTRERTIEIVGRIQSELRIETVAHLTCVGHAEGELHGIVERLQGKGIDNILALRGDPPQGETVFVQPEGGFGHASDLAAFLRAEFEVDVAGACYPESHPESKTYMDDLRWTKHKVEQGVSVLTTQLFFDNKDYFGFVERARNVGIGVPIVPGIMPITNVSQIERFTQLCGARIPEELRARLVRYRDEPEIVMATGIEWAILQCRQLLERGAPGIHFYTLNKSHATRSIMAALRRL